jgi:hypothetical protein
MSKKQLVIKEMSQFPAAIKKLWGPPSILPSEDPDAYWKLAWAMAQAVEPTNAIEWMYLKDIVDYAWEIRQLRRHKAQLTRVEEMKFHASEKPESREQSERYFATAVGEADLFLESLSSFEAINKLLEVAEGRRTAVLRELENYQRNLASRLRKASDDAIIEGEFTETDPASGTGGERAAKPDVKADVKADNDSAPKENDGSKPRDAA